MESAGRAASLVLDRLFPRGRVAVVAGSGNNGGDAVVVGRVLRAWGRDVSIVAVGAKSPDAALLHGDTLAILPAAELERCLLQADVVVDGVLGTGLTGAARGGAAEAISAINRAGRPVLALDLPSGLSGVNGEVQGPAVRASATVSFGWPKAGLMFQPARALCGRMIVVEIGFPPLDSAGAELITPEWAAQRLPVRAPDSHKGASGRLLVVAGREGMAGAAALAGQGARRAGAGLVRICSTPGNRAILQTLVPEATFVTRAELSDDDGALVHALVLGPGMGADDDGRSALERALSITQGKPALLDADAVTLFADRQETLREIASTRPVVITPHPGELQRLLGMSAEDIVKDPAAAAAEAVARLGCTVLLKGQPSIVAAPDQPLLINTAGSSDTATAGMGDQLAGAIGAFLAAGLGVRAAAGAALFYSSRAADLCALGRSLGPRDVAEALPAAFERPGDTYSSLRLPFVTFDQPARW
jgi:NAD(P)H-hydrate epimerase